MLQWAFKKFCMSGLNESALYLQLFGMHIAGALFQVPSGWHIFVIPLNDVRGYNLYPWLQMNRGRMPAVKSPWCRLPFTLAKPFIGVISSQVFTKIKQVHTSYKTSFEDCLLLVYPTFCFWTRFIYTGWHILWVEWLPHTPNFLEIV